MSMTQSLSILLFCSIVFKTLSKSASLMLIHVFTCLLSISTSRIYLGEQSPIALSM